jgi:short-subunit dehydrogenase
MIAVVTGASSGIGAATARRLAQLPGTHLILVARREHRLEALADALESASICAADLTDADAAARIADVVSEQHGGLDLLVNNAGATWPGTFAERGLGGIERHMELNFFAAVRLTEALLPMLRASAPSAIVNVASVAGWVARPRSGAYSASKAAMIAWSEALRHEEAAGGVHVGLVLPGFIATEGFPQRDLRGRRATRWLVSTPEKVAGAIADAWLNRTAERYVPRPYALAPGLRVMAPALMRRAIDSLGR